MILFVYRKHRSSHRRYSVRKGVLRNFAKFTGKHLCRNLFFNKAAGLRQFPVNFAKFLRTSFLTGHLPWLLLETFFDLPISNENERIRIEDYNLLQVDHLNNKIQQNNKVTSSYYKKKRVIHLKRCLVTEIMVRKKSYFFMFI